MFDSLKTQASAVWSEVKESFNETRDRAAAALDSARNAVNTIVQDSPRIVDKALPAALAACASLQYKGAQGSFESFMTPWYLRTRFLYIDTDRSAYIGYPLHTVTQLSNLSGFCLCEGAVFENANAEIDEVTAIEAFMNNGFFLE